MKIQFKRKVLVVLQLFFHRLQNIKIDSANSDRVRLISAIDKVTNITYGPLPQDSPYVKPFRFHYTQNGKEKSWDLLKVHDSVSIIIFNVTRKVLVFVKQFRPGKCFKDFMGHL